MKLQKVLDQEFIKIIKRIKSKSLNFGEMKRERQSEKKRNGRITEKAGKKNFFSNELNVNWVKKVIETNIFVDIITT